MTTITRPFQAKTDRSKRITVTREYELIPYDYRRRIGYELRKIRLGADLTQANVGSACGVAHTLVSDWETGRKIPQPEHFAKLQKLFDVPEKSLGRFLLRYTNPAIYALLYGLPVDKIMVDLDFCPERIACRADSKLVAELDIGRHLGE